MKIINALLSTSELLVVLFAMIFVPSNAFAAFHLWDINEIYSNADGTFQFIELATTDNSQQFISGRNIDATSDGNLITFTFPNGLGSPTANRKLLLATSDLAATSGFPTPDFIIPSNFFDPNAAAITINFAGVDSVTFTSSDLPTDGTLSIDSILTLQTASPTNFAGNSASPPFETDDTDGDGVPNGDDSCPNSAPDNINLNPNQYAQNSSFGSFEVGPNDDQSIVYDMTDTEGCTCKQIVELLGVGRGHLKKGCSPSVMEEFTVISAQPDRQAGIGKK